MLIPRTEGRTPGPGTCHLPDLASSSGCGWHPWPCTWALASAPAPGPCSQPAWWRINTRPALHTESRVLEAGAPPPHQLPGWTSAHSPPTLRLPAASQGPGQLGQRTSVWPPPPAAKRATCPWDRRGGEERACPTVSQRSDPPPQAPLPLTHRCFGVSCSLKGPPRPAIQPEAIPRVCGSFAPGGPAGGADS